MQYSIRRTDARPYKRFAVSPSSIRRKLTELEKDGLVVRTHGGVKSINDDESGMSFFTRKHTNALEKRLIAIKALKLVHDGDMIFLDSSSTSYFLAEYLSEFPNVTVVTNGVDTLAALATKGVNVYSSGGKVYSENNAALTGEFARAAISKIHADLCFFGSRNNVGRRHLRFISALQRNNKHYDAKFDKKVCLCDNTKTGKGGAFKICNVYDIDYIVCDRDISGAFTHPDTLSLIF